MLSVREICTSFQEIFADVVIKDGRRQARLAMEARHERTLSAVACTLHALQAVPTAEPARKPRMYIVDS